jgi:hypothetical protein
MRGAAEHNGGRPRWCGTEGGRCHLHSHLGGVCRHPCPPRLPYQQHTQGATIAQARLRLALPPRTPISMTGIRQHCSLFMKSERLRFRKAFAAADSERPSLACCWHGGLMQDVFAAKPRSQTLAGGPTGFEQLRVNRQLYAKGCRRLAQERSRHCFCCQDV